jgi:hypothetical protein
VSGAILILRVEPIDTLFATGILLADIWCNRNGNRSAWLRLPRYHPRRNNALAKKDDTVTTLRWNVLQLAQFGVLALREPPVPHPIARRRTTLRIDVSVFAAVAPFVAVNQFMDCVLVARQAWVALFGVEQPGPRGFKVSVVGLL